MLWAFVRLVMFDNPSAFVDLDKPHPCDGMPYGETYHNGSRYQVDWRGMYLSKSPSQYVHTMAYRFNAPSWWEQYKLAFGGQPPACVGYGDRCEACEAERRAAKPYYHDCFQDD